MDSLEKQHRYRREIEAFYTIVQRTVQYRSFKRILVLGCGRGWEALMMQQLLDVKTYGIDIHDKFEPELKNKVELITFDGNKIPFHDQYFDLVYSYHVLEHVQKPISLIAEVNRVLQSNGIFYLGVPNRDRIVGYFGMKHRSLWQKITSNIRDWQKRLKNQWQNPSAHAGFSQYELEALLSLYFKKIFPVSKYYYMKKWPRLEGFLHLIWSYGWDRRTSPSVYMIAQKQ